MANRFNEVYDYAQKSADALIHTGPGVLGGIFVSAASGTPTITIYDNTSAAGAKIVDIFTPEAGKLYAFCARYIAGLYIDIGGTVAYTVLFDPVGIA